MQNLVDILEDRSVDFLDRVAKAYDIFEDCEYLYPGKIQMLFDWLSASLLKIGKFDDTSKSSKLHVFSGFSVWDLFLKLLKYPFGGTGTLLSQPQIVQRRLLKLNSPVLVILGQFFRTTSKMDTSLLATNLEKIHLILSVCNEHYFDQLGQNPVHFCGLLESIIEALNQGCSSELIQGCSLECIRLCFAFTRHQANKKKSIQLFYERFFPPLGQLFQFYPRILSFEASIEETFKGFLFEGESVSDLAPVLDAFYAHNRVSLLKDWATVSAGVETSSGFYQQLPEQILAHGRFDVLLAFLFKLIVGKSTESENVSRTFTFNLFSAVIVALTRQPTISFASLDALLKTLLHSNMYQHRNDDIYKFQTDFLGNLLKQIVLPNLASCEEAWSVLSVLTELNFYLVSEQFHAISASIDHCPASQNFVICFLRFSISARQLGAFLPELVKMKLFQILVDADGNPPIELSLLLKKLSNPLTLEAVERLVSMLKDSFNPNAYFLASLLLQYSNFPDHFLSLANCCFDLGHHQRGDAFVERFLLCFFNRTSILSLQKFSDLSSGFDSVDALLAHRLGRSIPADKMKGNDLVRFIPILEENLQDRAKELLDLIVGEYVLRGSNRYTPLLRNAKFYESNLVKHHLIPYLESNFENLSGQSERLLRFICALPSELFSDEHSQHLFDNVGALTEAGSSLKVKALVTIALNPAIAVSGPILSSLHSLLAAEEPRLAGRLVSASIRRFGVSSLMNCFLNKSHGFTNFSYLKPLLQQCNPDTIEDVEGLRRFCLWLTSLANDSKGGLDLIESIINVSAQFNFQDILDSFFVLFIDGLKSYQDQIVPGNLLVCLAKVIRAKDEPLPASQYELLLALCSSQDLKCPSDAYEKAIIILLESMPFELFQGILKNFAQTLASSNAELKSRIVVYVSRLLNSSDKARAKLCFELGCWALKRDIDIGMDTKLSLSHRLVISKSLRPINSSELSLILEACHSQLTRPEAFEEVCGILMVLQQSYWPLLKTMMPVYVVLFQRILEQQASSSNNPEHVQLFVRVLSNFGGHTGLSFHLTPLLLQFVSLVASGSLAGETLKTIEKALLPLLKHLESPSTSPKDDPSQINAIDNFGRLLLMCQQSDQKTVVKRMVEDYRKEYKYTGKA